MKKSIFSAVLASIMLFGLAAVSSADEIVLKNGDKLTGTVKAMENGKLVFHTSYAGDITIDWSNVKSMKTDTSAALLLRDGTLIRGALVSGPGDKVVVNTGSSLGSPPLNLAEVIAINPKSLPQEVKLTGHANVSMVARSGNTNNSAFNLAGEVQARTNKNRYTLGAEFNREEDEGKRTVNNGLAYAKYDHFLTKKLFFYANTVFEKDKMADLSLRSSLGVGIGYQVWESHKTNLSLEAGLSYVNEDYEVGDDNNYAAFRWAVNYDRYIWNDFLQFFHFHEGMIGLEDTSDITLRTRTGFRMPIKNGFTAVAQYNWDWDNTPAPGNDSVDEALIFGLGYQF